MPYNKTDHTNKKPATYKKGEKNPQRKPPKKITERYLHNAGLYYLERFSASKAHFIKVMVRKVKRSCEFHKDQDLDSCKKMVLSLADKFENCGLLNDTQYADALAASLRRKGLSSCAIRAKMRCKGVSNTLAVSTLEKIDTCQHDTQENAEFSAALVLAKRRKIGPFFAGENQNLQKSLGILARAGFTYHIAQRVLHMHDDEYI
ncbi:MAG: regulatory protein RecX [Alphaproteobacteria bacterium]